MPNLMYYRKEAARCRELADHSPDGEMARRWRALASDYDKLAEAMGAAHIRMPQQASMQQQPMQQQQSKKTEPDGK